MYIPNSLIYSLILSTKIVKICEFLKEKAQYFQPAENKLTI